MKLIVETDVTLVQVQMEENEIVLLGEGDVGKYGHVFFTHHLIPSNAEETKGRFTGFARTILADGGSVRATLSGIWRRDGAKFRVHSLDDVIGLPDQNYIDISFDILTKRGSVRVFSVLDD
ncbi:MAG: hypothetical protein GY768_24105 [Planctomycetaceae bacterium]|nr:hypothetical protein [Planctomycetaceae bacterium]